MTNNKIHYLRYGKKAEPDMVSGKAYDDIAVKYADAVRELNAKNAQIEILGEIKTMIMDGIVLLTAFIGVCAFFLLLYGFMGA